MQQILILGAGRSATSLIQYLCEQCQKMGWEITIAEQNLDLAKEKIQGYSGINLLEFDVNNAHDTAKIENFDLVISMLPAQFHDLAAKRCAAFGKHFLTASYLTEGIKALNEEFKSKGASCIMELGLDPGLDHMSAMKVLDRIKAEGHELIGFETFTGGLLTEDSMQDNPWKYKFTWNPRNVVLAGQGHVKFIQEDRYKYIPYHKLFQRTEMIHIPGHGYFEGYANRDSLKYLELYNLEGIKTLYRGTLRRRGFCRGWDVFVQLGATDDTYQLEAVETMTHRQFLNNFLQYNPHDSIELKLAHYLGIGLESEEMYMIKWLGMFSEELVGLSHGTPAQILEHILKKKWTLNAEDKDLIVMWHKFDYLENGAHRQIQAHMAVAGEDQINTAMSKTVGLPLGIAAKNVLTRNIAKSGTHIPTHSDIYNPILEELSSMGFEFEERQMNLNGI